MPKREVDKRKTTKALRKLRRVAERATEEGGPGLTTWEKDFVDGVTERLEKYGSAFRDPGKGRLEEALSARQAQITRVIDKKSRKSKTADPASDVKDDKKDANTRDEKSRSTFKQRQPMRAQSVRKSGKAKATWQPRVRDIHDDVPSAELPAPPPPPAPVPRKPGPPSLKIIPGGKR